MEPSVVSMVWDLVIQRNEKRHLSLSCSRIFPPWLSATSKSPSNESCRSSLDCPVVVFQLISEILGIDQKPWLFFCSDLHSWGFLSLRPEAKAHWCGFVEDTGFAWRGICKATWLHQNTVCFWERRDPRSRMLIHFPLPFRQILDILATWHPKLGNKEYRHKCLVTPTSFGEVFSSNLIFLIPNIEGDDGYAISNDTFGFLIQKLQGEQPPWDWTALETASENAKTRHISRSKSWEHIKVLSRLSILIWNGSLSLALFLSTCHSNKLRMVLVRNSSQP